MSEFLLQNSEEEHEDQAEGRRTTEQIQMWIQQLSLIFERDEKKVETPETCSNTRHE